MLHHVGDRGETRRHRALGRALAAARLRAGRAAADARASSPGWNASGTQIHLMPTESPTVPPRGHTAVVVADFDAHPRRAARARLRGRAPRANTGVSHGRCDRARRPPGRADGGAAGRLIEHRLGARTDRPQRRPADSPRRGYDAPVRYPVEDFTAEERALLAPHFTNLDRPVFALVNLPETVKGALFARYSRYSGTVRRLYLEEFAAERRGRAALRRSRGRARGGALRAGLPRLRRRLDRPGRRRPRRLRVGLQHPHQAAAARPPRRLPGAVDPLHPLRQAAAEDGGGYRYYRDEELGPEFGAAMDEIFAIYSRSLRPGRGVGGGALAARRRRTRGALAALDPGQGARPAARPAAGGDAQPRRHLRLRPGLRAAAAAADGLAAAGGARVRRDDPERAEAGDAELRLPGRAPRPRRRVGLLPRTAPRGDRASGSRGSASTAATPATAPPRSSWSTSTAPKRTCSPPACSSRPRTPETEILARLDVLDREERAQLLAAMVGERPTAATAPAAASRRCATASRSSPTTAPSATCSATGC